ncbi:modification methylase [Methanomicrobiaceae archaeon CYW5]|uniref:DNA-methyltransferase n=1 Tax=Methanovulcanius yangii TaxID=1789227 RepID=UPI0029C9C971|nr:site-specific DNA-methyltransferase [Methanovulcanius yangii]MBT8507938.1 modification methylase [Methanovulcanius yangii]
MTIHQTAPGLAGYLDSIHLCDCIEGMQQLPDASIDIIVTSPPYNIGKPYNSHNDTMPRDEYLAWMGRVAAEARRILKDEGSFFLNVGGKPSDQWIPYDVLARFREHYELQNVIHWVKSVAIEKADIGAYDGITKDVAVGHYQPVNSRRYLSQCHEHLFHFTKNGGVPLDKLGVGVKYQDKSNIGRWKQADRDLRDRGNVWFIPYRTIRTSRPHPASFPEKLPEMCIRLHGFDEKTVVCDPFMGIGSTALAAITLNTRYIGYEIDPAYRECACERIRERLEYQK